MQLWLTWRLATYTRPLSASAVARDAQRVRCVPRRAMQPPRVSRRAAIVLACTLLALAAAPAAALYSSKGDVELLTEANFDGALSGLRARAFSSALGAHDSCACAPDA